MKPLNESQYDYVYRMSYILTRTGFVFPEDDIDEYRYSVAMFIGTIQERGFDEAGDNDGDDESERKQSVISHLVPWVTLLERMCGVWLNKVSEDESDVDWEQQLNDAFGDLHKGWTDGTTDYDHKRLKYGFDSSGEPDTELQEIVDYLHLVPRKAEASGDDDDNVMITDTLSPKKRNKESRVCFLITCDRGVFNPDIWNCWFASAADPDSFRFVWWFGNEYPGEDRPDDLDAVGHRGNDPTFISDARKVSIVDKLKTSGMIDDDEGNIFNAAEVGLYRVHELSHDYVRLQQEMVKKAINVHGECKHYVFMPSDVIPMKDPNWFLNFLAPSYSYVTPVNTTASERFWKNILCELYDVTDENNAYSLFKPFAKRGAQHTEAIESNEKLRRILLCYTTIYDISKHLNDADISAMVQKKKQQKKRFFDSAAEEEKDDEPINQGKVSGEEALFFFNVLADALVEDSNRVLFDNTFARKSGKVSKLDVEARFADIVDSFFLGLDEGRSHLTDAVIDALGATKESSDEFQDRLKVAPGGEYQLLQQRNGVALWERYMTLNHEAAEIFCSDAARGVVESLGKLCGAVFNLSIFDKVRSQHIFHNRQGNKTNEHVFTAYNRLHMEKVRQSDISNRVFMPPSRWMARAIFLSLGSGTLRFDIGSVSICHSFRTAS
jgi:hypothetical protein